MNNSEGQTQEPVGMKSIDVEALAETFAKGWPTFKEQDSEELLIEGFKAGYATSQNSYVITIEWLNKLKPDYDHKESYQHGFHDAIDCIKKRVESITSLPQSKIPNYHKVISETPQSVKDKVEEYFNEMESSTSEGECQHPFKEVRAKGPNFYCDKCKQWF